MSRTIGEGAAQDAAQGRRASRFELLWLAEAVRLHEAHVGPFEDAGLVAELRAQPGSVERRLLARARLLAEREGWRALQLRWLGAARIALLLLALAGVATGAGLATALFGGPVAAVNLLWALLGLLGLHLATLLLWLLGTLAGGAKATGAAGRIWLALASRLGGGARAPLLGQALAALLGRGRLGVWAGGTVSHLFWTLALVIAVATLLLLFSVRRYGFYWETTLLSLDDLAALLQVVGAPLAAFGVPTPDSASLLMSADVAQPDGLRRAWAGWLIAGVVVYGVVPRMVLGLFCWTMTRRAVARSGLDFALPEYVVLRQRLDPEQVRLGVSDPEAAASAIPRLHPSRAGDAVGRLLVGLELGERLGWPPAGVPPDQVARVDSRDERHQVLQSLDARPVRRLLVACDARLSPDRGSLGFIAELAARSVALRVVLLHPPADPGRKAIWRDELKRLGLAAGEVGDRPDAALAWLEGADG